MFGYYSFAEIPAGEIYTVTVDCERYTFSQPSQVRKLFDDTQNVDLIAGAAL